MNEGIKNEKTPHPLVQALKDAFRHFQVERDLKKGDEARRKRHEPINDFDADVKSRGGHFDWKHPDGTFSEDGQKKK